MEQYLGKVAVVTGASSGIGAALAKRLVKSGLKVVGLARRKERLDDVALQLKNEKGQFYPFCVDMTKEEDILKAFEWTKENVGQIHILVNNAGIYKMTSLINGNANDWNDILNTNVLGLCIASREAVNDMVKNNVNGQIININSTEGHEIKSGMNMYGVSKHALAALTDALRLELNSSGKKIKVSSISPGATDTDMLGVALCCSPQHDKYISQALQADDIVDAAIYVLSTPSHVQIRELIITHVDNVR